MARLRHARSSSAHGSRVPQGSRDQAGNSGQQACSSQTHAHAAEQPDLHACSCSGRDAGAAAPLLQFSMRPVARGMAWAAPLASIMGLGRASVLASLSTSLSGAGKQQQQQQQQWLPGPAAVGQLVDTLRGLPLEFSEGQAACELVYQFHKARNGLFPRPCPECNSPQFFVEEEPASSAGSTGRAPGGRGGGGKGPKRPAASGPLASFHRRPFVCDQCQRWFHLGCLDVDLVEDVPSRPWFHCR
jgi:hypothetical protein